MATYGGRFTLTDSVREPDAGDLQVRFDEGDVETESCPGH